MPNALNRRMARVEQEHGANDQVPHLMFDDETPEAQAEIDQAIAAGKNVVVLCWGEQEDGR